MKNNISVIAIMLMSLFLVIACNNPKDLVQGERNILSLSTPSSINSFRMVDDISVEVQNNSDYEIVIDPKETILSMKTGKGWMAVENLIDYSGKIYLVMPKSQKDTSVVLLGFSPIIPNDKPATVRITIKGTILSTKQKIEDQIDITLNP